MDNQRAGHEYQFKLLIDAMTSSKQLDAQLEIQRLKTKEAKAMAKAELARSHNLKIARENEQSRSSREPSPKRRRLD